MKLTQETLDQFAASERRAEQFRLLAKADMARFDHARRRQARPIPGAAILGLLLPTLDAVLVVGVGALLALAVLG